MSRVVDIALLTTEYLQSMKCHGSAISYTISGESVVFEHLLNSVFYSTSGNITLIHTRIYRPGRFPVTASTRYGKPSSLTDFHGPVSLVAKSYVSRQMHSSKPIC